MTRLKKCLTFSNAVAVLALFFALGGTVYAAAGRIDGAQIRAKSIPGNRLQAKTLTAAQIQAGAIGAAQIKPGGISGKQIRAGAISDKQIGAGAIGEKQIKAGAITEKQVRAGSIGGAAIKSNSLSATQINQSTLTAISAANIHAVQYSSTTVGINKDSTSGTNATAACPPGMKVIGGGATTSNPTSAGIFESSPTSDRNGWFAAAFTGTAGINMTVTAICTLVAAPTG